MYQRDAGQRSWHYDGSDFVVTLKLQNAEEGGEFEYAPLIRGACNEHGDHDERYDQVAALFAGTYTGDRVVSCSQPGTINIFNGKRSLHRVRAVYGPKTRILSVLSYDTQRAGQQTAFTREDRNLAINTRNYGERIRALYALPTVVGKMKRAEADKVPPRKSSRAS